MKFKPVSTAQVATKMKAEGKAPSHFGVFVQLAAAKGDERGDDKAVEYDEENGIFDFMG